MRADDPLLTLLTGCSRPRILSLTAVGRRPIPSSIARYGVHRPTPRDMTLFGGLALGILLRFLRLSETKGDPFWDGASMRKVGEVVGWPIRGRGRPPSVLYAAWRRTQMISFFLFQIGWCLMSQTQQRVKSVDYGVHTTSIYWLVFGMLYVCCIRCHGDPPILIHGSTGSPMARGW